MKKLFVDTNIVIDLLTKRKQFFEEAQELFTLADRGTLKLYVSALTIANIHYLLRKTYSSEDSNKILLKFKVMVEVLPLNDKILELALASEFNDFEDAIQYYSALENDLGIIITRNERDFKKSQIPIMNASVYLKSFR